jgi:hypothetical protein
VLRLLYPESITHRTLAREKSADQFTNGICLSELLTFFISVVSGFNSPTSHLEHASAVQRSARSIANQLFFEGRFSA